MLDSLLDTDGSLPTLIILSTIADSHDSWQRVVCLLVTVTTHH